MRFMADGSMNIHLPSLARNWKYVAIGQLLAPISERKLLNFVNLASISPEPCSRSYRAFAKGSCFATFLIPSRNVALSIWKTRWVRKLLFAMLQTAP